jgi:hypothetical protein
MCENNQKRGGLPGAGDEGEGLLCGSSGDSNPSPNPSPSGLIVTHKWVQELRRY